MTPEVANQREVSIILTRTGRAVAPLRALENRPGFFRQREIVVNARYGLHAPSIAMRQAVPVYGFCSTHVGTAIPSNGNFIVGGQPTGHAGAPQHLIADMPIYHLVKLGKLLEACVY